MLWPLPNSLVRTRRGICPTCGAPLELSSAGRLTVCSYCDEQSTLSFRLRNVEPELTDFRDAEPRRPLPRGTEDWLASHGVTELCNCPGCGSAFETDLARTIHTCVHCGAACKLESRLEPHGITDVPEPVERTEADFENQARKRIEYPWDIATEQLVWRILNEPDELARLGLASRFCNWHYINHTAAHFLPWLLRQLQRDHDHVAKAGCDVIGKLLCEGDKSLILPVLHACEETLYDINGKPCMVFELGLGPPVGIKTLLDVAEYAAAHKAYPYARQALFSIGTIFSRHFDAHQALAEIVLYRMFYLSGPILGWAMYMMRNGFHNGVHLPVRTLILMIDEFAHERPEVIPAVRANLWGAPETTADFLERVELMNEVDSLAARAACSSTLGVPPRHRNRHYARAVKAIEPLLDEPRYARDAEQALTRFINQSPKMPSAITALVQRRGETLPHDVKRYYIKKVPDTPHLDTRIKYYLQSEPRNEPSGPELKLIRQYKDLIDYDSNDEPARHRAYRARLEAAAEQGAALFLREGPATIPVPDHLNKELQRARKDARREQRRTEYEAYAADYTQRLEERMATMRDPATPPEQQARLAEEITIMAEEFGRRVQELLGGPD